jgi:hypothetical protein
LDYAPLWAHDSSTETFTPYSSPTLEADRGGDALRGGSRLCMGCHDGAVAPDAYYGMAGTEITPGNDAWNGFGIAEGGDMTNDHPVGFSYGQAIGADATANGGYSQFNSPGTTLASLGLAGKAGTGIVTVSNLLRAVAGGPSDLVTCASCHDVHNSAQVFTDDAGMNVKAQDYLLYVTQEDSGLCVTCHAK